MNVLAYSDMSARATVTLLQRSHFTLLLNVYVFIKPMWNAEQVKASC